jgi:hypothetical protein
MRQVGLGVGRLAPAALLLLAALAGCAPASGADGVARSSQRPELAAIDGIATQEVLDQLARLTFDCSPPQPDPAVALISHTCTSVSADLDSTATAIVTLEASPDGGSVYLLAGRVAIRAGEPDDDLIVGLCGNVLGSLPFTERALPDLVQWTGANAEAGATARFGSLTVALSGPPADRQCRFSAIAD